MINHYDKLASYYDTLARFVFGRDIVECQIDLIPFTSAPLRVLILGGGTGWILPEMLLRIPNAVVTYVEASNAMIEKARSRMGTSSRITFIHATDDSLDKYFKCDLVITNFFVDQFDLPYTLDLSQRVYASLSDTGIWLISDFVQSSRLKNRILLRTMYLFFRVLTGIPARTLPPWEEAVNGHSGFTLVHEKRYKGGFIVAKKFQKTGFQALR
jgi:tRNA (cmo5U34)-methyltransferase